MKSRKPYYLTYRHETESSSAALFLCVLKDDDDAKLESGISETHSLVSIESPLLMDATSAQSDASLL